jgi:hypothetical protein
MHIVKSEQVTAPLVQIPPMQPSHMVPSPKSHIVPSASAGFEQTPVVGLHVPAA